MSVLHIINKSPFDRGSLDSCLRLALAHSAILLIEDGVYAMLKNSAVAERMQKALEQHPVYALRPDMQARGIAADAVIDGIELIDYDGFVTLVTEFDKSQSWL